VDLDKFKRFFTDYGVEHEVDTEPANAILEVPDAGTIVSVSQAHFYFDNDGMFLGVRDDEMGRWFPRLKTGNPIDGLVPEEQDQLAMGRKIMAIKMVRNRLGIGLREAMEFVERYGR